MRITLLRLYIGTDELNKIITSNQNQLNNVSPVSTVSETPKATDTVVPKVNKKSFLFGEINQILESRKPTEEDKKKINDERKKKSEEKSVKFAPLIVPPRLVVDLALGLRRQILTNFRYGEHNLF